MTTIIFLKSSEETFEKRNVSKPFLETAGLNFVVLRLRVSSNLDSAFLCVIMTWSMYTCTRKNAWSQNVFLLILLKLKNKAGPCSYAHKLLFFILPSSCDSSVSSVDGINTYLVWRFLVEICDLSCIRTHQSKKVLDLLPVLQLSVRQ